MQLSQVYNQLYHHAVTEIQSGREEVDVRMNRLPDKMGIILRIRPSADVLKKIGMFLEQLRRVEPAQYYYPDSDIHITVVSVILPREGFQPDLIHSNDYCQLIRQCLAEFRPFEFQLKGITASPGAVMIQGFETGMSLTAIRDSLYNGFNRSSLPHSIEGSRSLQLAHSTVVRFREELTQRDAFLRLLEQYREHDFGHFQVDNFELVYNDWYHRKEFLKHLALIKLGSR